MDMPHYVELDGPPRQRGRMHGESLRGVIGEVIGRWLDRVGETLAAPPLDYVAWLARSSHFREAIQRWTPDLADEVAGIADGAGLAPELAWTWQMLDEHPWLFPLFRAEASGDGVQCSGVGLLRDDGPNLIAQTLDIPLIKDGAQTLLRIRDDVRDIDTLVLTQAGAIASLGLNSRGLGLCVNSLDQLPHSPAGLPVTFAIRGVLAQPTLALAADFLRRVKHATGQNYLLGSPDGILDLECSAAGVADVPPLSAGRAVIHTNHPLAGSDAPGTPGASTRDRLELLQSRVTSADWPRTPAGLRELLATPPVCVGRGGRSFTAAGVVMELGDPPVMHVAPGPPDQTPWSRYELGRRE